MVVWGILSLLCVRGQGHQGETRLVLQSPTQLAYKWYALAASGCTAAPTDARISWRARGDIGGGVDRCSLGDLELPTMLAGHSELGAVVSSVD